MAYPSSYSEATLKGYMHDVLSDTATVLGWATATNYGEAVNEAVAAYGADDITTITGRENLYKLRALARREVWRAACGALAAKFDFSADGHSLKRSDLYAHAKEELARAETDALPYDSYGGYNVGTAQVSYSDDWYEPPEQGTAGF
jgi:hypothetical protein